MRHPLKLRVGLALGGGAARGLAHMGVLRVLEREEIPIDIVVGTSMGAILGGAWAATRDAVTLEQRVRAVLSSEQACCSPWPTSYARASSTACPR